jgi:beta-galactosidase
VRLRRGADVIDEDSRPTGFRDAKFTPNGFELNGKVIKLRGLDRHQTFPFVGQAMPARVQRRDAWILKKELKCNIVRTSHYPQSPHFLDACDELGLLVLEEIPGWQHIGDADWKQLSVDNVRRMVRRDWNHPSIVLWGVRINESGDDHDFYTETNRVARELDATRQTCGIRYKYDSELLEDVFTMNDFGFPLRPPNHPLYLNTEFCGHTYPTKPDDPGERLAEHVRRHARVQDQLASDSRYAGGLGWCAFDYNTHFNFGSGDRICYHGVSDIFRIPKPAAHFYRSQCEPGEEIVLEPAFQWNANPDWSQDLKNAVVCSNCDHLKFYKDGKLVAEADSDRKMFPNLKHPPFTADLSHGRAGDLTIEGYVAGNKVVEKLYPADGIDTQVILEADDRGLLADGADCTRVVVRIGDDRGNTRRYSTAAITFSLEGPGELIGENPFSLVGGAGAVWVRAKEQPGRIVLTAAHQYLGRKTVEIQVGAAPAETV